MATKEEKYKSAKSFGRAVGRSIDQLGSFGLWLLWTRAQPASAKFIIKHL